ncbi:hypothetical protein [Novosphingobium sp. FSW06-99]|uniref:hypothetical protein n=1 Tax=Novosphingobium sp. FSW06-99 TaxID=1739113 RepID=UPI00076C62FD|nr:hypothetical protein [Novosphingobium sp. FSW06-99]KUR75413.1 hypothetical protein AQZ49_15190 [Novosphingobium sp. FSW06-99]
MHNSFVDLVATLAVFSIPITAIVAGHRTKMAKLRIEADSRFDHQANDRIAALEDRIRVLERIVTDRGSNLAQEIEALRGADAPTPLHDARATAAR